MLSSFCSSWPLLSSPLSRPLRYVRWRCEKPATDDRRQSRIVCLQPEFQPSSLGCPAWREAVHHRYHRCCGGGGSSRDEPESHTLSPGDICGGPIGRSGHRQAPLCRVGRLPEREIGGAS